MTTETLKQEVLKICIDATTLQLLEKAETVIAEHESTLFNAEDWKMFFDMLENPPEPTEHMKKAAQAYKKMLDENKS